MTEDERYSWFEGKLDEDFVRALKQARLDGTSSRRERGAMTEIRTGEDVARRLIELTDADKLYWHERESRGEWDGYYCEVGGTEVKSGMLFVVDYRQGANTHRSLSVGGSEIIHDIPPLKVLYDHIKERVGRQLAKEAEDKRASAIASAAAALKNL